MRGSSADPCGCFPTGRHYPGIADAIADAIAEVAGLCAEHDPSVDWRRIPIAVIDFETTGTSPTDDRIVEVSTEQRNNPAFAGCCQRMTTASDTLQDAGNSGRRL